MRKTASILAVLLLIAIAAAFQTHTFPALDTNNVWTGTNTFNGVTTFGGAAAFTGASTYTTLNNVCIAGPTQTIAACIAALPASGGNIYIMSSPTPYSIALGSLTITKPIRFTCEHPWTTELQFTGASGVAFLFQYGPGPGDVRQLDSGIENCTILGPGGFLGAGNAGTGIQVGSATANSDGLVIRNSLIAGFSIGVTWPTTIPSNSTPFTLFDHDVFTDNTQEVVYNSGAGPGITEVEFHHVAFDQQVSTSNPNSLAFTGSAGGEFAFLDCYFNGEQIQAITSDLRFTNPEFENAGMNSTFNYVTVAGGTVTLDNPNFLQDAGSGTYMLNFAIASSGSLTVRNWRAVTGATMTTLFAISGTAQAILDGSRTEVGTFTNDPYTNSSSNVVRVYDKTGKLFVQSLGFPGLWVSSTAPAVFSGFGTSANVTNANGTGAFTINVGTGGVATSGVITMPTAATGWNCMVNNVTASAGHRADSTVQTATAATSVTVENQTKSTGAAVAWTASDNIALGCFAR